MGFMCLVLDGIIRIIDVMQNVWVALVFNFVLLLFSLALNVSAYRTHETFSKSKVVQLLFYFFYASYYFIYVMTVYTLISVWHPLMTAFSLVAYFSLLAVPFVENRYVLYDVFEEESDGT